MPVRAAAIRLWASAAKSAIEFDAEPVALKLFGRNRCRTAAEEGIENEAGFAWRFAIAGGCESCPHCRPAEGANHSPAPGHTAVGAAGLWTTGLNGSSCQSDWEDRVVTGDSAGRDLPDVARILAERMADTAFGFEDVKPDDRVAVRPSPCFRSPFL